MGMIGGILRAGEKPEVVHLTKNTGMQRLLDTATTQYGENKLSQDQALSGYIKNYLAGQPNAQRYAGEETGAVDQFYNGNMASRLASLRANRAVAVQNAADVAAAQAVRNSNMSRLNSGGGPSSYDTRALIGSLAPIRSAAALDNSNQERSDLNYITGNQLDLSGRRADIQNRIAGYGLVPEQMRAQIYNQQLGQLGQLGQLDQSNNFYGVGRPENAMADVWDSIDQGILNVLSTYSGNPNQGGGDLKSKGNVDYGGGNNVFSPNYKWGSTGTGGVTPLGDQNNNDGGGDNGYYGGNYYDEGFARGGLVRGRGTSTSDSVPIRASAGEYVVPEESLEIPGVFQHLEAIRGAGLARRAVKQQAIRHYVMGGLVRAAAAHATRTGTTGYANGGLVQANQWVPEDFGVMV